MIAALRSRTQTTPHAQTEWISWAKVVAIAAVIAIHTVGYNAIVEGARSDWLGRAAIYFDKATVFCVPLFVMISGALLLDPARYRGAKDFLMRRGWRLVPAIIFWHAFYFLVIRVVMHRYISPWDYMVAAMNGKAFQALYYFWIILGLVLITPLLMPWIAQARRKHVLLAGGTLALMPVLTVATHALRGRTDVWVETPWTWWIFYAGFYLLGWAIRDLIVTSWLLACAIVLVVALSVFGAFAWGNPDLPSWVGTIAPTSYYTLGTLIYTVALFVVLHSLIARVRPFTRLAAGRPARVGRTMGDATLGVFALHSALIVALIQMGWPTETPAVDYAWQLLARYVVVFVATYVIVLIGRRIPFVRRVL